MNRLCYCRLSDSAIKNLDAPSDDVVAAWDLTLAALKVKLNRLQPVQQLFACLPRHHQDHDLFLGTKVAHQAFD